MSVTTSAGTTLAISAAQPATYSAAGYAALTYTEIGEVGDLGDIPTKIYDLIEWRNIASRGTTKAKGVFNIPPQTIMVGYDPEDAGQAMLAVASDSDAKYSVRINHPTIGAFYGQALVMGGAVSFGDGTGVITSSVTLEYSIVSNTEDGLVIAPPAG